MTITTCQWFTTGASQSIGLELSRQLLQPETPTNTVFATCRSPASTATDLAALTSSPGTLHVIQLDVASEASIKVGIDEVLRLLNGAGLDYVLNNAAINHGEYFAFNFKLTELVDSIGTNVAAPALISQHILSAIEKSNRKCHHDSADKFFGYRGNEIPWSIIFHWVFKHGSSPRPSTTPPHTLPLSHFVMQTFSTLIDICAQFLSKLTLYELLHSSHDFSDVKEALNGRMNWAIELFRSSFTIRFASGGYLFTTCSLLFLFMAETMFMHYGRLSPLELKKRVDAIGHVQFAILFAVLDAGVIIVRVAGIFALSEMPALATGLAFLTVVPSIIPLLVSCIALFKAKRACAPRQGAEADTESGAVDEEARG